MPLCRLGEPSWGEWTTVVYTPTDDSAVRRTVLVQPCQLESDALQSGSANRRLLPRHASSKTTTEIYSHVTAAQERQAAEVLEAALAG